MAAEVISTSAQTRMNEMGSWLLDLYTLHSSSICGEQQTTRLRFVTPAVTGFYSTVVNCCCTCVHANSPNQAGRKAGLSP